MDMDNEQDTIELKSLQGKQKKIRNPLPVGMSEQDFFITTTDTTINQKYPPTNTFLIFLLPTLSSCELFDIVSTIEQHPSPYTPTNDCLKKLRVKNRTFNTAIEYYATIAKNNLEQVTVSTLNTIDDPHKDQPHTVLNLLPYAIKNYVMRHAYTKIKHYYDIVLSGHKKKVTSLDINCKLNLAATSSNDGNFVVWDLNTSKAIEILPEKSKNGSVTFALDHDLLATQTTNAPQECTIKIWNAKTRNLLQTINHPLPANTCIDYMTFLAKSPTATLAVFSRNIDDTHTLSSYLFDSNYAANYAGAAYIPFAESTYISDYLRKGDYVYLRDTTNSDINQFITKKNCANLYLCEQAIRNTNKNNLHKNVIEKSKPFQALTMVEKEIIIKEIDQQLK